MRYILFMLALATSGCMKAQADSITQTNAFWAIKTTNRPNGTASTKPVHYSQYLGSCSEDDFGVQCPFDGEEKVFNSDWSYVKCTAHYDASTNTNHYYREFKHTAGTAWVSSWPTTTNCHVNGTGTWTGDWVDTTTTIVAHPDPDGSGGPKTTMASLSTSVPLVRDANAYTFENVEWAFRQPPAGTYIDGTVQCKKANGTNHIGLTAFVDEMGAADYIKFTADEQTVTNASYCPISKNGVITNTPVPVTVE